MASQLIELRALHFNQRRCGDCSDIYTRSYHHRSDKRCYSCEYEYRERTVNPIQMGNRHNHQFSGEDMRYYRFTVRGNGNLLTVREAKKLGMVCKREGRLSRYFDEHGTLLCAYSYNTCIYARVYDKAEGYWRDVFNFTPYSKTTGDHVGTVIHEILGFGHWVWLAGYVDNSTYDIVDGNWTRVVRARTPLSERARRAFEFVRVATGTTASELAAMAEGLVAL